MGPGSQLTAVRTASGGQTSAPSPVPPMMADTEEEISPADSPVDAGSGLPCGKRADFLHFLLISHSFTGLIFARPDDAPPIQLAGCCGGCCVCLCCGKGRRLTVRHRLFIFFFTLVATFFITMETALGLRSVWWALLVTCFIVVPLTCWLKGSLPRVSSWLNRWQPSSWQPYCPRIEEALLLGWLIGSVVAAAYQVDDIGELRTVAKTFVIGLAIANAIEVAIIVFLFCPCRTCCPCCMPPQYEERFTPYDSSRGQTAV